MAGQINSLSLGNLLPPNPLPLNYYTIFTVLEDLFPDHYAIIFNAIKKIIVIKDNPNFKSMGINSKGYLVISKEFWDEHMIDPDALKTVLLHELLHHISGDVFNIETDKTQKDYQLRHEADNLAMDTRINAFICQYKPEINPEKFLVSFYTPLEKEDFLFKLLKPASIFNDDPQQKKLLPHYNKCYNTEDLCSHHDLSDEILKILKSRPAAQQQIVIKIIGLHGSGDPSAGEDSNISPDAKVIEIDVSKCSDKEKEEMEEKIKEQLENQLDDGSSKEGKEALSKAILDAIAQESAQSCGKGSRLMQSVIADCLNVTEKFDLARFKKLAFDNIFHNVRSQARQRVGSYTTVPYIPAKIYTSDIIRIAAGVPPILYKTNKFVYKTDKNLLPIYLDVSGSTMPYLPEIVKLIANVSTELDFVWGFSDYIHKHTMQDLLDRKITSSGGTSFQCIIDHVIENQYKHFVVITDGDGYQKHAGPIPGVESVVTILFGYARKNNYFSEQYDNTHMIDEVKI